MSPTSPAGSVLPRNRPRARHSPGHCGPRSASDARHAGRSVVTQHTDRKAVAKFARRTHQAVLEFVLLRLLDGQVIRTTSRWRSRSPSTTGCIIRCAPSRDELQSGGAKFRAPATNSDALYFSTKTSVAPQVTQGMRRGLELNGERRIGREQAVIRRKIALPIAVVAAIEHIGVG